MIILKTRCGCSRAINGSFQTYGKSIFIALQDHFSILPINNGVTPNIIRKVRRFDFEREQGKDVIYLETEDA